MAVAGGVYGGCFPSKFGKLSANLSSQKAALKQPPPPIFISTDPIHVNPLHLRDLYTLCNHSAHRFPQYSSDGQVDPVDINKLSVAISHSSVVVSVFAKPDVTSYTPPVPEETPTLMRGIGGDWVQRLIPLSPANGRLVGFGRAVTDFGLTASIYDVMVIPKLQGRGIGRMIVQRIIRLFFKACGFGNDILESTTMMYTRTDSHSQAGQMLKLAGRKLLLVPPQREISKS